MSEQKDPIVEAVERIKQRKKQNLQQDKQQQKIKELARVIRDSASGKG